MRISMKAVGIGAFGLSLAVLVSCGGNSDSYPLLSLTEQPPPVEEPAQPDEPSFTFEPITLKKVAIPAGFKRPGSAVFLPDGEHIVAGAAQEGTNVGQIVLANVQTGETRCVTCRGGEPLVGIGIINPFPDGKRLFLGFYGVLECAPSVVDCQTYKYLPYDLSNGKLPVHTAMGFSPKLSPDGKYMAYSNIRSDGYQEMIVAKLVRQADKYVVENPRVMNPPGPSSLADPSVDNWSLGSALYEFKTFTRGGAAATYVQVGGADSMNPDLWEVDLKTGVRTRLTTAPDWDEDMGTSPDGKTLAVFSSRTYHAFDWTGSMLPHRGFLDAPIAGPLSGRLNNAAGNFFCGGPMWLLPASGDANASIAGQPIVNYKDPMARVTVSVVGRPMWNAQSTMLALQATTPPGGGVYGKNAPDYILVAEFPSRKATEPEPIVSSEVGPWAVSPADYHPSFGYSGNVTLIGPGGGTVSLSFNPLAGVFLGNWSAQYNNYSEDGKTFLSGNKAVTIRKIGQKDTHITANLVMSGERTGSVIGDLTFYSAGPDETSPFATSIGTFTVSYEGTTVSGPPSWIDDPTNNCPTSQQAKAPQLVAQVRKVGSGSYSITVTASVAGTGQNQAGIDTRPVRHALIDGGGRQVYTNVNGVASVTVSAATQFKVTAGDTLVPTLVLIDPAEGS